MSTILRCTEAFAVMEGGIPRVIRGGDVVDSDDEVVKGHEGLFEPLEDHFNRARAIRAGEAFETATAAPGEVRATTKPHARKRAPAKKAAAKKATAKP